MPERTARTIAERWNKLDVNRQAMLQRVKAYSALTLPAIFPETGTINNEDLPVPNNSMPAEGLNSLASRIVSVLLPLNGLPIFELLVDFDRFPAEGREAAEVEFRRMERSTMNQIIPTNVRDVFYEAALHLMVVGNCAVEQREDFGFRLWRFDQFVVKRYTDGRWYELITRDSVNPDELPPELDAIPKPPNTGGEFGSQLISRPGEQREGVYTKYERLPDGNFRITKEFRNTVIEERTLPVSPIAPLRWKAVTGEDYGRGEVEESFGDITTLDSVTRGAADGALLNAEHRWRISPLSLTSVDDFLDSVNGEVIAAEDGEIGTLQFQNHAQVGAALNIMQHFEKRLGRRFLMNSAIQPTGDRVTARQVTILAEELEAALGGVLSMISRELQIPIVRHTLYLMSRKDLIPPELSAFLSEGEDILQIRIRAGLEILQREAEFEKLSMLVEQVRNLPPAAQAAFRWPQILRRWMINMGLDPGTMIKTDEELANEMMAEQQQQQASMMQQQAQQMMQQGQPAQA